MKLDELKTLTGLSLKDLAAKLDAPLPDGAYKGIAGTHGKNGDELTDIDPNYMNKALDECFGVAGIGHGFTYATSDLTIQNTGETGMKAWIAYLTQGVFWYVLVDAAGKEHTFTIQHSGGSMNGRPEYAAKGALTSAIAGAVSKLGFQQSVYLGLRSHKTVGKQPGNGKGAPIVATQPCPIHQVPMRTFSNGKTAHQLSDKTWCYGAPVPATPAPAAVPAKAPVTVPVKASATTPAKGVVPPTKRDLVKAVLPPTQAA